MVHGETMRRFLISSALSGLALGMVSLHAHGAEEIKAAVSGAAESSHVFCDATGTAPVHKAPCHLRTFYVTIATAVTGFVMTFDAVSAPADGAVTPRECIYLVGPGTIVRDYGARSEPYITGLTAVWSTTGCFTKTASATAFFKLGAQ
jgi:hypothetical protein